MEKPVDIGPAGAAWPDAAAHAGPASLPLTDRSLGDVPFRVGGRAITTVALLADAAALAERLPSARFAINICRHRYHFLVAFAAALIRGQTSLLSSDHSRHRLLTLATSYAGAYTIGDECGTGLDVPHFTVTLPPNPPRSSAVPRIPAAHTAAIVLTSGSTGEPIPNPKPWAALVACSRAAAARFGFEGPVRGSIVGMVPPQHMYGFETTVLLPLHATVSSFAGATFYPEDVIQALAAVPEPRTLVTTPRQIRTLLASGRPLPPLHRVISATAPLADDLAAEAEAAWATRVEEIFGATEVGSIASRRTLDGDRWRLYRSVRLRPGDGDAVTATVAGLPGPVALADRVELQGDEGFRLLGRKADVVKLAGKRASLAGLDVILNAVPGVDDGAFFDPGDLDSNPRARLVAFVVAPGRSSEEIIAELRHRVEPAFLPRRVIKVSALPRNDVGKLPRTALEALHVQAARPVP